jgi:hypothetical protein
MLIDNEDGTMTFHASPRNWKLPEPALRVHEPISAHFYSVEQMEAVISIQRAENLKLQDDLVRMTHRVVRAEDLLRQAHELCEAIALGVISRNNAENLAGELEQHIREVRK